jgi:hypothetical protein
MSMCGRKSIRPYRKPAGGRGALKATDRSLIEQRTERRRFPVADESAARFRLSRLRMARPKTYLVVRILRERRQGDSRGRSRQNAARQSSFASHKVTELASLSDYELEMTGRLTLPMVYDVGADRYVPIAWDAGFALVGATSIRSRIQMRLSSTPPGGPPTQVTNWSGAADRQTLWFRSVGLCFICLSESPTSSIPTGSIGKGDRGRECDQPVGSPPLSHTQFGSASGPAG